MVITQQVKKELCCALGVTSRSRRFESIAIMLRRPGVRKWKIFYSEVYGLDRLTFAKGIPDGYDTVIHIGTQANALKQVRYQYLLLGR